MTITAGADAACPGLLLALAGLLALIQARVVSRVIPRHEELLQALILHWMIPIVSVLAISGAGRRETSKSSKRADERPPVHEKRTRAHQKLRRSHVSSGGALTLALAGVSVIASAAGHAIVHAILCCPGRDRPAVSNLDRQVGRGRLQMPSFCDLLGLPLG